jgi:protein TonB
MSRLERSSPIGRAAFSAAVAAAVNLLLLGALLALNGSPAPVAPSQPRTANFRATRLETAPRPAPARPAPATRVPEEPRTAAPAHRDVPLLSDAPVPPGVRSLDFVPGPGISDLGVVPFDLALAGPGTLSGNPGSGAIGGGAAEAIATVGTGELDRAPREVSTPPPAYPIPARRAGVEGKVELNLLLAADGSVERIEILRWEGHSSFPESVRRGLLAWRFTPAIYHGRPIRVWKPYVVKFKLDD